MKKDIQGVLPCLLTPYDENYQIDKEDLKRQVDYLYDIGADGVVVGQVSEVMRLSSHERYEYNEMLVECNDNRGVVIVSTGAESTKNAIDYTRQAESVGVDCALVMHPSTTALNDTQVYDYYSQIIKSVDIPVMVHHAKSYAKNPLSAKNIASLVNEFGADKVLYKPESSPTPPKLSILRDESQGKAKIFEGDGGMMIIDCYKRGIAGCIPATDIAEISVKMWKLLQQDNVDEAMKLGTPLSYLMCQMLNSVDCYQSLAKYHLKKIGVMKSDRVRGPVDYIPDEETLKEIDRIHAYIKTML